MPCKFRFVIQKLFEYGTHIQKTALANTVEARPLAPLQMYGSRVVQKVNPLSPGDVFEYNRTEALIVCGDERLFENVGSVLGTN